MMPNSAPGGAVGDSRGHAGPWTDHERVAASRFHAAKARRFTRVVVALLALSSFLIPLAGGSAASFGTAQAEVPQAVEVRSLLTDEWALPHPTGLAYFPEQRSLLVTGTDANETSVLGLTTREDSKGTALLPEISHPATVAFDAAGERLTAVSGSELISVTTPELEEKRPEIEESNVANLGLQNPQGAAFDPATGTWFILDDATKTMVRVPMPNGVPGAPARTSLQELGPGRLQGLALNPADGLFYVASPDQDLLYGLDGSGTVQKTYSLGPVGLQDLRAMVFAPSADPTDDPGTQHLFMADTGDVDTLGSIAEVSLAVTAAAAPTVQATIVQTIDMSQLNPPSPDPAGITYFPATDRLEVSDSEVDEMSIFQGVNLYQLTRTGSLTDTGVTTAYTREPTGLGFNPANGTLFVSSDDQRRVFLVRPGPDGRYGTADDQLVSSIDVTTFGLPVDAEGVEYDTTSGHVFIVDGVGREVWRVNPGPNGTFGDGDDVVSHFDVERYGARDPEGIGHDAARDTLLVLDHNSRSIYEVRKNGDLVRTIDVSVVTARKMAGVSLAPGTNNSGVMNLWVVARGVDNNANPNENDGKLYELSIGATPPPTTSLDRPVAASADDVEERPSGRVLTASDDLELVNDGGNRQIVGLRFTGIVVPPGASVVNAYVQFQTDEATSGATTLNFRAEATNDAAPFTTANFNVSSRPRTAAKVTWAPPAWTVVGGAGVNQRTPNLGPVLQQVFNRPGWASGNALALIINGSGKRVAEAFDGERAPVLHIEFTSP